MRKVSMCLNTIVKDEEKVLPRLLDSVKDIATDIVIVDTGSVDNTKDLLVRVFEEPFENFGKTRTKALQLAYNHSTSQYILLLDADMEIKVVDMEAFQNTLFNEHPDVVYIYQRMGGLVYENIRLLKNKLEVTCVGATHEYYMVPTDSKTIHLPESVVYIEDHGDGGCKQHKFQRDKQLLTKELESDPTNPRSAFYLAQTLRDLGEVDRAIQAYEYRTILGGWHEEIAYSYYAMIKLHLTTGNITSALGVLHRLEDLAEQHACYRIEPYLHVCRYYREQGNVAEAAKYYTQARLNQRLQTAVPLFHETNIDTLLDFEEHILFYYMHPKLQSAAVPLCIDLLANDKLPTDLKDVVVTNLKFYLPNDVNDVYDE